MHFLERIVALLSWCTSVRPSVRLSVWDGVHYDHTLYVSADLSLWLDSPMFWAPWHQSMFTYFQPSFTSSAWKTGGVCMCKLGVISRECLKVEVKLLLTANRKSYMPRWLAQQRMTLSDLEWPFHTSRAIYAVDELLVIMYHYYTNSIHRSFVRNLCSIEHSMPVYGGKTLPIPLTGEISL